MDSNMYILLREELKWLEANSHLHTKTLKTTKTKNPQNPTMDLAFRTMHSHSMTKLLPEPPSPLSQPQFNGQKWPLSDDLDAPDSGMSSKADLPKTRAEEDWLWYLLPMDTDGELEPMVFYEERIVSRYISKIDSDCILVTGPGGDMVYLKISVTRSDGRLKKLDLEGHTKGESNFMVAVRLP
ncbi:hypothetical protein PVL29_019561 [Vitis rotundifolia]|uniref:Uncharacterized protein n=1 Tax=Vitis rotundifolia TaxID=103349 RepID=A0AA38Z0T4_VITRO|nr:hypothetical protein PVL29_019561 [Vitis rotundifolia]